MLMENQFLIFFRWKHQRNWPQKGKLLFFEKMKAPSDIKTKRKL